MAATERARRQCATFAAELFFSEESPKAEVSVGKGYRFIGTQLVNLYGVAEAEQYVFAEAGSRDNSVESFYWIQFEHFLPSNDRTYNYGSKSTTQIGDLQFSLTLREAGLIIEARWRRILRRMARALSVCLRNSTFRFRRRAAHVRLFHSLPVDHRSELMIIYGEALPENSAVPVREKGLDLDKEAPESAQVLLEHARQGLVIRAR